ncbi:MAG: antitoxin VbhA family protein [Bacilli bacterium]|nr:antitoxin VbhA family protein [Bacilli bacterium]MBO6194836.1 antitoxin VbhA family protein [Bacilli bacterium]
MKYLIKDTTEEERRLIVNKALGISLSGAEAPSKEVLKLAKEYIEGKKELDEIQKIVLQKYKGENK